MFQNNQRQSYRESNEEGEGCNDDHLEAEESEKFWGDIWSELVDNNRGASKVRPILRNSRR